MKKIVVLGTGYVGLVSGACMAEWGHHVICVDINTSRVEGLKLGVVPIFEPGLDDLILSNMAAQRLEFTTDLKSAIKGADVALIAVGTPPGGLDGEADLQYVFAAARNIADSMSDNLVVVTKSTVPVGTGDRIERIIREVRPDGNFAVASNPEFLREGSAIFDFMNPDRVVIGTDDAWAKSVLSDIYKTAEDTGTIILTTGRRSAELIKYGSNAFLAAKITFINEMADLCEKIGADIKHVSLGMGLDKRIGPSFLSAGPGYGGSCFPKDTIALLRTAQEHGVHMRLVEQTISVNAARKRTLINRLRELVNGSLRNKRVAIFGLTFKANTDDMRDSPSLSLIQALQNEGAKISAFDPEGMNNARRMLNDVTFSADPYQCAAKADIAVMMTDWDVLVNLDFARLGAVMRERLIVDLRGVYDEDHLADAFGFHVSSVGKASPPRSSKPSPPRKRVAIGNLVRSAPLMDVVQANPKVQIKEMIDG